MKKISSCLLVIFWIAGLTGQPEMRKVSWAPEGKAVEQGTKKLVYSLGEVFVDEVDVMPEHLSEGFIGPDLLNFLGLTDYKPLEGVEIFPNPVSDFLTIRFPEQGRYEVYLYDLTGKAVFIDEANDERVFRLHMKNYLNGLYLLVIVDREKQAYFSTKIKKI